MPLTSSGVKIPFDAETEKLIAESNKVVAQLDRVKESAKANNAAMLKSAQQAEQAAKKSTSSWTEFRSMYSTVLDVVRVGQAVWEEVGQKYVDNAVTVGNLARALGTTTEEASRLKEVADDTGVGMDSLKIAMRTALKDGFEPGIEGLAKMADEYLRLEPGTERMQFLMDRFGKSGEEMGKLLEKGGDGIRNMAAAMDESLIVTEEAYQQARQYQVSVDALKDSWDAFTYQVAPPLVDALTTVINTTRDSNRAAEMAIEQGKQWIFLSAEQRQAFMDAAVAEREQADAAVLANQAAAEAGQAFETEAEAAQRLEEEAKAAAQAIQEMSKANQEYLDMVGSTSDKNAKHQDEINKVNQEYAEGNITIQERDKRLQELADAQEEASRRMILSMLEQELAIDGLDAKETDYLLRKGVEWGIYSETAIQEIQDARAEVAQYVNDINNIPSVHTLDIVTNYSGYTPISGSNLQNTQYASGGEFIIPPSYGPEGFKLGDMGTASGGEKVTITTPGSNSGGIDYNRLARTLVAALATAGE